MFPTELRRPDLSLKEGAFVIKGTGFIFNFTPLQMSQVHVDNINI